jgi:hypothetical protein
MTIQSINEPEGSQVLPPAAPEKEPRAKEADQPPKHPHPQDKHDDKSSSSLRRSRWRCRL